MILALCIAEVSLAPREKQAAICSFELRIFFCLLQAACLLQGFGNNKEAVLQQGTIQACVFVGHFRRRGK